MSEQKGKQGGKLEDAFEGDVSEELNFLTGRFGFDWGDREVEAEFVWGWEGEGREWWVGIEVVREAGTEGEDIGQWTQEGYRNALSYAEELAQAYAFANKLGEFLDGYCDRDEQLEELEGAIEMRPRVLM